MGIIRTKYDSRSKVQQRGIENLPLKISRAFLNQKLEVAPIFDTKMPQSNSIADAMDYDRASSQNTFKGKYGYNGSGVMPVYQHVINLTREFLYYAK